MFLVLFCWHLLSYAPKVVRGVFLRWNAFFERFDRLTHSAPSLLAPMYQILLACAPETSDPVVAPLFPVVLDMHRCFQPCANELFEEYNEFLREKLARMRRVEDYMS